MSNSSTFRDIFCGPIAGDLGDLLLTVFDAGVSYGMGYPAEPPQSPAIASLLETVRARWHAETRAHRSEEESPILIDEVPGWLLSLPRTEAEHDESRK